MNVLKVFWLASLLIIIATTGRAQRNWEEIHPAPRNVEAAVAAYDPIHGEIILFGGREGTLGTHSILPTDTWSWDGQAWQRKYPLHHPPGRFLAAMTYDPNLEGILLFGGQGESVFFNDTWLWDGQDWTQLFPARKPSPRDSPAMAYDAIRWETVLYGGVSESFLGDTWTWDGLNWREHDPDLIPFSYSETYSMTDFKDRQEVLLAYSPGPDLFLMYTWDGANWNYAMDEATDCPYAREYMQICYDPATHKVILFGGSLGAVYFTSTWSWDGTDWTLLNPIGFPPGRNLQAMAYDLKSNQVLLFGGRRYPQYLNDTWTWDGVTWTERDPDLRPIWRQAHGMAFDQARGEAVVFGGRSHYNFYNCQEFGDTWIWREDAWVEQHPDQSPSHRSGLRLAYDEVCQETVLFGGLSFPTPGQAPIFYNDTWVWKGGQWSQKNPRQSPQPRLEQAMAYDNIRQQVVMFGGWGISSTNFIDLADTQIWDGVAWSPRTPAINPGPRHQAAMAFDEARGVMVLFGGVKWNSDDWILDDTWIWDGTNWLKKNPVNSPPARADARAMVYDAAREEVILFGGYDYNNLQNDTWSWDGENWQQIIPPISPWPRSDHAMVYDDQQGRVVVFGGQGGLFESALDDTWVLPSNIGDVNDDGFIDSVDALLVNDYAAEKIGRGQDGLKYPRCGDLDRDKAIDARDLLLYQLFLTGKIDRIPWP